MNTLVIAEIADGKIRKSTHSAINFGSGLPMVRLLGCCNERSSFARLQATG